ncbi:hypothetical protein LguiB_015979 [Lonicera macranthoides]
MLMYRCVLRPSPSSFNKFFFSSSSPSRHFDLKQPFPSLQFPNTPSPPTPNS